MRSEGAAQNNNKAPPSFILRNAHNNKKREIGALYELCAPSATPHFSLLTPHYVDRRSKKTRNYTNFPFSTHVWPTSTFASSVSPTLTPS